MSTGSDNEPQPRKAQMWDKIYGKDVKGRDTKIIYIANVDAVTFLPLV